MAKRIYLCLAHMSGAEQAFIQEAFDTNWVVPLGPNVNGFEDDLRKFVGEGKEVVALSAGTAAVQEVVALSAGTAAVRSFAPTRRPRTRSCSMRRRPARPIPTTSTSASATTTGCQTSARVSAGVR